MDCGEVLRRVEVFLEHTSDADGTVAYHRIEQHLHECPNCEHEYEVAIYQVGDVIRALVSRCCHEHAPDELRRKVLARLKHLRLEPS
jgi:mycothiol system anti-sigma-R factor